MTKNELVSIRDGKESDLSLIFASWLRGLYYGDTWFNEIPKNIFMTNYHRIIESILNNKNTKIRVACLKDDPEVILSYVVMNKDESVLHWIFTKKAWRLIGISKSLVPSTINTVTHLTDVGRSLIRKKPGVEFNPFAL